VGTSSPQQSVLIFWFGHMKCIIQQVRKATITITTSEETITRSMEAGIVMYVCFEKNESNVENAIQTCITRLTNNRMLSLWSEKIDQTLKDVWNNLLVVSNFTLAWRFDNGRKPDFGWSAWYKEALSFYNLLIEKIQTTDINLITWEFGAMMSIDAIASWPIHYVWDL